MIGAGTVADASTPTHRGDWSRQIARGLLIGATVASFVALAWLTPSGMLANGTWWLDEGVRYRAATLMFNYIDLGAVRRGLGGTLLRLTGLDPLFGLAVFHLLSSVFTAAVMGALIWQRAVTPPLRALWTIGIAALFLFWSADSGRTDVVLAGLLGLVALLARRRPVLAAVCFVVAIGFHETALIYGLPLVLALWLDGRWHPASGPAAGRRGAAVARAPPLPLGAPPSGVATRHALLTAAMLIAVAACVQALMGRLPHADFDTTVQWFWSRFPRSEAAEWALYFYVAGARGIKLAVCNNRWVDPNYAIHLLSGLVVIGAAVVVFNGSLRRGWLPPLLAGLVPFLFLSAITIDMTRWSTFAAVNAWLVCVTRPAGDDGPPPGPANVARRGVLLSLLIFAVSPRHVTVAGLDIFSPAPVVDRVMWKFTGPRSSPGIQVGLRACDPTWRELLVPGRARVTR